jgi:Ca2+-transporting ATPase
MADVERLAQDGLRVIAVASGVVDGVELPQDPHALRFTFAGLIGFLDPPRANAAAAVAQARRAGITVVMITGDYPVTAAAVARAVGIDLAGDVLAGSAIDAMDDLQLAHAVRRTCVFARIRPEQKLRLVQAFKANGEIVAMTGDGVNDAPALKAAHIGLAMGERGTDVAREAAGIVLLDDDIGNLVAGVHMGRRIFDNLRKVLIYIAAIHVPIAGLALLPMLMGLPPLLLPMHVVLIEMVIDPICSIAFESAPAESDLMQRPPRDPNDVMVGGAQLGLAAVQGMLLLIACIALYIGAMRGGVSVDAARALAFVALTAGNLMLVRVDAVRGLTLPSLLHRGHGAFWLIAGTASTIVASCIFVPWLAHLFRFDQPSLPALGLAAAVGMLAVLCFDFLKLLPAVQRALGGLAADRSVE